MSANESIKADERRFSRLNQGHSTMSDTFSALPLRAIGHFALYLRYCSFEYACMDAGK